MTPVLKFLYMLPFAEYQIDAGVSIALVGAACAIPGTLLLLRRMVMIADAISHVVLFGIVTAFLLIGDLRSPLLLVGAAASGFLTVILVETLQRSRWVKTDAAIGLVFPALFSIGVLLASLYTRMVHLDIDSVLLGHAEFASFDRLILGGVDYGPWTAVVMSGCLVINASLLMLFYKEVKLATFDVLLAQTMGFTPWIIHYGIMCSVSVTTVAAFDAVGPILVVAFFAVPPATAYLLTDRLSRMFGWAILIALLASFAGTVTAFQFDTNLAGTVTTMLGILFALVFIFAPRRGLVATAFNRYRQRKDIVLTLLVIHLYTHEGTPEEPEESRQDTLHHHLHWSISDTLRVTQRAISAGLATAHAGHLTLTESGRFRARQALNLLPA